MGGYLSQGWKGKATWRQPFHRPRNVENRDWEGFGVRHSRGSLLQEAWSSWVPHRRQPLYHWLGFPWQGGCGVGWEALLCSSGPGYPAGLSSRRVALRSGGRGSWVGTDLGQRVHRTEITQLHALRLFILKNGVVSGTSQSRESYGSYWLLAGPQSIASCIASL